MIVRIRKHSLPSTTSSPIAQLPPHPSTQPVTHPAIHPKTMCSPTAGQLLHVVDQATGHGLTDAELKSEMGIIFAAVSSVHARSHAALASLA